jgi:predicted transglutaminase-like cysteine proteinase
MAARETLQSILDRAHQGHDYKTDRELHGKREHWTVSLEGDCEDFALWCRKTLKDEYGISSDLVFCKTETGGYHLVLSVEGWILDNRRYFVTPKDNLPYTWLKIGRPNGTWYDLTEDD